ncbi:MAG: hypothetical protein WDN08_21885 [Rhizomicrobium sp.]
MANEIDTVHRPPEAFDAAANANSSDRENGRTHVNLRTLAPETSHPLSTKSGEAKPADQVSKPHPLSRLVHELLAHSTTRRRLRLWMMISCVAMVVGIFALSALGVLDFGAILKFRRQVSTVDLKLISAAFGFVLVLTLLYNSGRTCSARIEAVVAAILKYLDNEAENMNAKVKNKNNLTEIATAVRDLSKEVHAINDALVWLEEREWMRRQLFNAHVGILALIACCATVGVASTSLDANAVSIAVVWVVCLVIAVIAVLRNRVALFDTSALSRAETLLFNAIASGLETMDHNMNLLPKGQPWYPINQRMPGSTRDGTAKPVTSAGSTPPPASPTAPSAS